MVNEDSLIESASLEDSLANLANLRRRPILLINRDMDWDCVREVRRIADGLGDTDGLTVLLNSPGGDMGCVYRMLLALRGKTDDIEALVPGWAKSAATFFCLGADSIHMGRHGELGPLDMQIVDFSSGEATQVSALETFKTLEGLLNYSIDSLNAIVQFLRDAPMDVPRAVDSAHQIFAAIASPLYSQIDPRELGEMGRYLSIGEDYAERAMRRWAYADRSYADRSEMARRLIWGYPDHGFVIDLTEAQEIGLKAERLDAESDMICETIIAMSENSVMFQRHASTENPAKTSQMEKDNDIPAPESASETTQAERPALAIQEG